MSEKNNFPDGKIEVSDSVLVTFVEKTIGEINGISLGRRKRTVKIARHEAGCTIDIGLDVNYGTDIPETVRILQKSVKERITKLAGVQVSEVNVVVEGLNIEELIKK